MQWSHLTEEKQKNQLAQTKKTAFCFIKTIIITRAITRRPSPAHQRCTAANDGKLQVGQTKQRYAMECVD
jgi:hypothetical protein